MFATSQTLITLAASLLHTFASPGKTFDKGITAFHVIVKPPLDFYSNLTQTLTTENKMKQIMTFLALTILILTACNSSNNGASMIMDSLTNSVQSQNSNPPGNIFTLADAEKIMGEPAHLIDSTSKIKGEYPKFIDSMSMIKKDAFINSSGYMANSKDKKTGRTGVVYFRLEEYADVTSAKNVY